MWVNSQVYKELTTYLQSVERLLTKRKTIVKLTKASEIPSYWTEHTRHIKDFTEVASELKMYIREKNKDSKEYRLPKDKLDELMTLVGHVSKHVQAITPSFNKAKTKLGLAMTELHEVLGKYELKSFVEIKVTDVESISDLINVINESHARIRKSVEGKMIIK